MWVQVGIDVFIPLCKCQAKSHLSSWFSVACAATIAHRNHFFCLYEQNKFSASKVIDSYRLVIVGKGFLKLSNLLNIILIYSLSLGRPE